MLRLPRAPLFVTLALASILFGGCGGGAGAAPPSLGVQSNVSSDRITLRHRPGPMTFATRMGLSLDSSLAGEPVHASVESRQFQTV